MKILLDTHLLLWAAGEPERFPALVREALESPETVPLFSPASLWEVAIKNGLGRDDFKVDPSVLRRGLIENGYAELPIVSAHAVAIATLPALHKDPFDRMLVAQAMLEGIELWTMDEQVSRYPGPIRLL